MTELILVLISAALANNLVLHQALAIDPALQPADAAARPRVHALGLATLLLIVLTVGPGQLLVEYGLRPLQLDSLRLFIFLPLCVLLIDPVLSLLQRQLPNWPFNGLKPLLLGNAALLGLCLQINNTTPGPLTTLAVCLGSGLGFWLVLSLLDDLHQRTEHDAIPLPFRGLPITLIGAGIMAMGFLGLNGLFGS